MPDENLLHGLAAEIFRTARGGGGVTRSCSPAPLHDGSYGCALGAMSTELSDKDERSRKALARAFTDWQQLIVETLARLRDLGVLTNDVDTQNLGTGLLAALQGGYILAQNARDPQPMADALDMALDRIDSFAARFRLWASSAATHAAETLPPGQEV